MNRILLFLLPSIFAIVILPNIANRKRASQISALLATISFLLAITLALNAYQSILPIFFLHHWMMCDKLGAFFMVMNGFIAMTASIYAIFYFDHENKTDLHPFSYRFYHTCFHLFILSMFIVILSNNLALLWIAMELATISSVILIALYQNTKALESAWKYLILCGVGIALALLGTVIVYCATEPHLHAREALLWTALMQHAPLFSPILLSIAFVFLLVGYGTKVGFFPLHNWLPDAHSESPAPISALLSGLLLNIALLAILRFQLILQKTTLSHFSSHLLLLFGFATLLFSAFSLLRQRQLKRLLAYSSMEHMGLITIMLGIGTPLAYFAAFLHMLMHALAKSAAFFASGSILQRFHTQTLSQLKGLCHTMPSVGWGLLICVLALTGFPPSGLFISELLMILALFKTHLFLLIPFVLGLSVAFIALLSKFQRLAFSSHPTMNPPDNYSPSFSWPIWLHIFLVVIAGLFVPIALLQPVVLFLQGI